MPPSVLSGISTMRPAAIEQLARPWNPVAQKSVLDTDIGEQLIPTTPKVQQRDITDSGAVRKNIYNGVLDSMNKLGALENVRHKLELTDLHYADPEEIDIQKQKAAILTGRSLYRRLRGTWRLHDKESGGVLDEKTATVAQVPHMTQRGTFVLHGTEYTVSNQMRLRPGIFTRIKANGEIESHINVMPGNGISHRYFLDPETGIFKINIGQAKLPLLPVLRALGVSDKELRSHWGDQLLNANLMAPDGKTIGKLYQRLVRRGDPNADEPSKSKAVADLLLSMKLDPEVTKRTLGKPYDVLSKDAILDTTKKLISVSRQESDPDDRDHLAFQVFYGPEDLLSERITKDKKFLRQLLWTASRQGNLKGIQPGALTRQLHTTILKTGLGQAAEEINPAELLDAQTRATRLGEGGIGDIEAVPDESRAVQPSHFSYLDPIRTPECSPSDCEVMTYSGWKYWPNVVPEDRLACNIDGRLEFHKPTHLHKSHYVGQMYGVKTSTFEYLVTPNHRIYTRPYDNHPSEWRIELAEYTHGRPRKFMCGGHLPYSGTHIEQFVVPDIERLSNNTSRFGPYPMRDWAEFMGWFLSEGHCSFDSVRTIYNIGISQSRTANPDNCDRIANLLTRMGFNWNYNQSMKSFIISGKQLATYFKQFGFCNDKWIPEELLSCQLDARQALMDALLLGDGRRNKNGQLEQFCSSSRKLAEGFQRLAFSLGYSSNIVVEHDKRKETYLDMHVVHLHQRNERTAIRRNYFIEDFNDTVYSATVPGGLLYLRRGNGFGHWSGNSFKVGVDTRLTATTRKGNDGRLYSPFKDVKTGETVYRSPQDIADIAVAFPGEMNQNRPYVAAMVKGTTRYVPREDIKYELPHFENAFSPLGNMIPLKSGIKGQRMAMGSRYLAQAVPLVNREAPLVQAGMPGQHMIKSFEDHYGTNMGAIRADSPGVVKKVTKEGIVVQHDDGTRKTYETYDHFPFSRKTYIHNETVVKPGDRFDKDQLLAKSNYTDDNGTAALGLNARIAFIPFRGANYEDAAVVSESYAKRATSEHMYQQDQEWTKLIKRGRRAFSSLFPTEYDRKQLDVIDDQGVVKPGTIVKYGDPLVLVAEERERTHSQIHRGRKPSFANKSIIWEHSSPGLVTDVAPTVKGVTVAVKAHSPMQVGDKLSNRFGGKGVIAEIVPDEQMPHGEDGTPFEIALNPLGMISRINPTQFVEAVLAKIAKKTGKPYKVEDFSNIQDLAEYTKGEMQKYGVSDTETITDPSTGRQIPKVLTGYQFLLKLHHVAESKGQGRGIGGYTSENIPAKGGPEGSKRIALLETNALLSHGATEFLRDAHLIRGQRNDDYWQAFMSGFRPPEPKVPLVYEKFVDNLKGSGINVVRSGRQMHIMAMTDKDVDALAGDRVIQNTDTVDWKEGLRPRKGGLFDPSLTGGHGGNRWSALQLHEPLPNPAFEEPIRRLLGLTQKKFASVVAGQDSVGQFGTGPKAIKDALENINLDKSIEQAEAEVAGSRRTIRDEAIRKLKYLKDAKRLGIHPKDWVMSRVPIVPPIYRPVSVMATSGNPLVSDSNYLYKELFDANQVLGELSGKVSDLSQERANAYNAFKGVVGLGDPIQPKNQEKQVKGLLRQVFGNSAKFGMVQRQLLGTTVELVGRAVITPNPDLDMDEVGLPENRAWDVYKPFIIRRMVQRGVPRLEAARAFKEQLPIARNALLNEMQDRPVVISRAPVLHRYGIMGFRPKLVKGDVMQISPLITKGFNADFDGDTMNYHVPATEEAKNEVMDKLLPSKNLLSMSDFKVHYMPSQEYQGGLYHASTAKSDRRPHTFRNKQDAMRAYAEGRISQDTPVEILQH